MEDLRNAMRNKQETESVVIRLLISAAKQEENKGPMLDDSRMAEVIRREIRQYEEMLVELAANPKDNDKASGVVKAISILQNYLPKQMTDLELDELIVQVIQDHNPKKDPVMFGPVMKVLIPKVKGRVPNSKVSEAVKQMLK